MRQSDKAAQVEAEIKASEARRVEAEQGRAEAEATSNVWNDGNIPANVYVQYLKDVNIAYSDLENQIKQITAALSMVDTPTVIPEMAWGTPAAI